MVIKWNEKLPDNVYLRWRRCIEGNEFESAPKASERASVLEKMDVHQIRLLTGKCKTSGWFPHSRASGGG